MTEPKQATRMVLILCEEDHVHIELMDDDGEVFATAAIDLVDIGEQIVALADEYLDLIGEHEADDIGPVAGSC